MPDGVNFGSWLSLEDYFFVGNNGAIEVATPNDKIAAICLPPLHTGSPISGPKWQSETDLLTNLIQLIGINNAIKVFHSHRTSYIDYNIDFNILQNLGIYNVRVPISWCLTEYDPNNIPNYINNIINISETQRLREQFTCEDPYYNNVYWPAIPKIILINLLQHSSKFNIKVILDIHTYPGATSIGTFSGLWPKWSKFWTNGDYPTNESFNNNNNNNNNNTKSSDITRDIGRQLFYDFIQWIETLILNDEESLNGLRGISSMNEPAHLAGLFTNDNDPKAFLPRLSPTLAAEFLYELNNNPNKATNLNKTIIPDGPHLRVLLWLTDSVKTFRQSKLPSLGKELHINIHESIFQEKLLDINDPSRSAIHIIGSWWNTITSPEERASWAILDMHHYHAWDPKCQGSSDGLGQYNCYNDTERTKTLNECTKWASDLYRPIINQECGINAKLLSAEFSASTHHLIQHACNDITTLRETYTKQINVAKENQIELFFWSYKMPYGGLFRSAWSFKHLMYLLNILPHPDESLYPCENNNVNNHIITKDELIDPIFDTIINNNN